MTEPHTIEFRVEVAGERLDKLLTAHVPNLTRTQLQALIKDGAVSVDDKPVKAGVKLRGGELVRVVVPPYVAATRGG